MMNKHQDSGTTCDQILYVFKCPQTHHLWSDSICVQTPHKQTHHLWSSSLRVQTPHKETHHLWSDCLYVFKCPTKKHTTCDQVLYVFKCPTKKASLLTKCSTNLGPAGGNVDVHDTTVRPLRSATQAGKTDNTRSWSEKQSPPEDQK